MFLVSITKNIPIIINNLNFITSLQIESTSIYDSTDEVTYSEVTSKLI